MLPGYSIRLAREEELPWVQEIERLAAGRFAPFGLAETLSTVVTSEADLRQGWESNRLWVAVDGHDRPVGFALGWLVGENGHLDELDVLPEHGRRGLGQALVETVCSWARQAGYPAVTLTTLSHIPWNAPFYERLGFRILRPEEHTAELRALLQEEIEAGLPAENRVVMLREL
jgi:GNAT superfamily N-acetyltransferase